MFVRIKRGGNKAHPHDYLQIVESYRDGGKPKHRIIANLGRLEELVESGGIDGLVQSLSRFSERLQVISAIKTPRVETCRTRLWGPPLVFSRLWEKQGIGQVIQELAAKRKFKFDAERVSFALALQRLCLQGSDLRGSEWIQTVQAPGFEEIQLQHLYRTVGFLSGVRYELEKELYFLDRDLFSQELDLLFIDTTSIYTYRDTETDWRKRGYSRDKRGDLPQLVLCVAVDNKSWPVAWEVFPGNTADIAALKGVIARMRTRFNIRRVVVVGDRGMMSRETVKNLSTHEEAPFGFILGCRMRKQKEVAEEVLSRGGRYHTVDEKLEVKEVLVKGRRYIVCRNPDEARKDAAARAAILEKLETALGKSSKGLIGNKGFKRFLQVDKGAMHINTDAVEADKRLDGKFVLMTNTDLPADEVAKNYKSLWRVERTFREEKSTLEVRPLYHQRDDMCIGHIVAGFLALRLEVDIQRRLDERKVKVSWPDLMQDLSQVQAVQIKMDGRDWLIRTDLVGHAYDAFLGAGVRPPPRVTEM